MAIRLVIVEEAYRTRGLGVLVDPKFMADGPSPPFTARLRLPDGTERLAKAELETFHSRVVGQPLYAMIRLPELGPDDGPPGTEIWRD